MKKFLVITGILGVFCLTACQKDAADFTGYDLNFKNEYQPLKTGSAWQYKVINDTVNATTNVSDTVITLNSLPGGTTLINNKLYYNMNVVSTHTDGSITSDKKYIGVINHAYSTLNYAQSLTTLQEILYLYDDKNEGDTWETTYISNKIPANYQAILYGTVVNKNLTFEVSGQTYNNVIRTMVTILVNRGDIIETYATYHFYIAKDIGIIQMESTISDGTIQRLYLIQHNIGL